VFSGRWTLVDQDLGEGTMIRGSRRMIAALVAAGLVELWIAFGATQPPPSGCESCTSSGTPAVVLWVLFAAVGWLIAFAYWRTRLLVAARGFRWRRPWRPLQADRQILWSDVADVEIDGRYNGRAASNWIIITLSEGTKLKMRREFSVGWWKIYELMDARWKALQTEAHNGLSDGRMSSVSQTRDG
jgi:hypothetical protein